ncbi:hypothetical protein EaACW_1648 [Erwinia amylovora ACW56400]|uniref:Uncharacterized protein n=2 Tax=Erwinia amylovora TaxID=552 RepID=A0A831ESA7_ERWAM|nr:hypothetical protein EaACW_1648 [Erwinia amylovora ACW56400]CBA20591.1 hypothetical protein predicted by Glimmer/Critica [Erwinia amylovora CFBP1430]CCO78495.1 hypothetical protein BN432_1692 [Erwinia amylovora Ea356]CCO82289.1 hypothetical protein BN433_1714 [Erwinia amylovora Ea266]CCO86077.1 hypothetical protein BN434_1684 [Erwinia amylovora CFBP 2585]CCO89867.1 hypothetical protein BN435_1691 [Erwinia amylovora 01SFR-BO]CCO93622.1 hypothetical protein BN437_1687 [Erwinia amylovora NBRC
MAGYHAWEVRLINRLRPQSSCIFVLWHLVSDPAHPVRLATCK